MGLVPQNTRAQHATLGTPVIAVAQILVFGIEFIAYLTLAEACKNDYHKPVQNPSDEHGTAMARLIAPDGQQYRLVGPGHESNSESFLEFSDQFEAFAFLSRLAGDSFNLNALRSSAADDWVALGSSGFDDTGVLERIASDLVSGRVRVVHSGEWEERPRAATRRSEAGEETRDEDEDTEDEEAPPPASDELTWIKFRVLDDETGDPVRGVLLHVKLTTGKTKKGRTDGQGFIEFTDIPAGSCDIERMIDSDALEVVSVA